MLALCMLKELLLVANNGKDLVQKAYLNPAFLIAAAAFEE
jgi:hypothetical protein